MWLLAVDTTSRDASVALQRDDRLVALVAPRSEEQHSVELFRLIRGALDEAGIGVPQIDVFGVSNGPGAFTALRVGLSVVKGLAEMHGRPVAPVSILEAVCDSAAAEGLLVPIVDAYRGQVFGGVYEKKNGELESRAREKVLALEPFLAVLEKNSVAPAECTLVGSQVGRWSAALARSPYGKSRREVISPVLADAVARLAARKFARGQAVDALHLEANYVRRSDAELLWKGS